VATTNSYTHRSQDDVCRRRRRTENIEEAMWCIVRYYKPHRKTVIKPNQMQKANTRNIPGGFYRLSYTTTSRRRLSAVLLHRDYTARDEELYSLPPSHNRASDTHTHTHTHAHAHKIRVLKSTTESEVGISFVFRSATTGAGVMYLISSSTSAQTHRRIHSFALVLRTDLFYTYHNMHHSGNDT